MLCVACSAVHVSICVQTRIHDVKTSDFYQLDDSDQLCPLLFCHTGRTSGLNYREQIRKPGNGGRI